MRTIFGQSLCVLGFIALAGCGSGFPSTVPASGKVTFKGQPVAGVAVVLTRGGGDISKGEIAVGTTDANGQFELTTHYAGQAGAKGAVPGSYKVTLSKGIPPEGISEEEFKKRVEAARKAGETGAMLPPEEQPPPTTEMFPEHANRDKTPLTAEIKSGQKNELEFAVK